MDKTLKPKNMDYFLTYDVDENVAYDNSPIIPRGTIVTDVRLDVPNGFDNYMGSPRILYKIKSNGKECVTHYPWALAEDTEENRELFKESEKQSELTKIQQTKSTKAFNLVRTLKG